MSNYVAARVNHFGPLTTLYNAEGDRTWDFTLFFEDAVLVTGPLALGALLILVELAFKIARRPPRTTKAFGSSIGWIKLVLYILLLGLNVSLTILMTLWASGDKVDHSELFSGVAAISPICAFLLATDNLMHHAFFLKPSSPSQLLLGWWLLSDVATVRTKWLLGGDNLTLASIGVVSATTKLAIIIAEELSKRGVMLPAHVDIPPESLSGIYNRILVAWINPLMYKSLFGTVSAQELWPLEREFSSQEISARLSERNDDHTRDRKSLLSILLAEYWWMWIAPFPTRIGQAALTFSQPFLVYQTLYWLYIPTEDSEIVGYGLLGAFVFVYVGVALTTAFGQYQVVRLIAKIRCDLIARIYQKSLRTKSNENQELAPLTLMSTNVDKVVEGAMVVQESFVSIALLGIGLWLLQRQIGLGAIGPVVIVSVAALAIGVCAPGMDKAQKQWLDAVKHRVQFATQVLAGFQTAKMSGLMNNLTNRLQNLRVVELHKSLALRRFMVMTVSTSLGIPNLSPLLALAVYAVTLKGNGETINEILAFTALAYLTLITWPLLVVMQTAPHIIQAYSSLTQIDHFLRQDDVGKHHSHDGAHERPSPKAEVVQEKASTTARTDEPLQRGDNAVVVENCTFQRFLDKDPVLRDININIAAGAFTFIVGPSASGKTTLLEALLGELICSKGTVSFKPGIGDIAYVAQRPWVRSGSVRSNIILTSPMDEQWYQEVIHACALDNDIQSISSNDTGSGGSALSGGQRQKVSLARAIYSRRKLIVIDEPFTGVDGISSEQIAQRLFGHDGLLRKHGITLILASHSGKHLSLADHVVALDSGGNIAQQGRPDALDLRVYKRIPISQRQRNTDSSMTITANPVAYALTTQEQIKTSKGQDRRSGEMAAYGYYFASLGSVKLTLVCLFVALFVFFQLFTQPWVSWWTTSNAPGENLGYWLGLYAAYAILAILALAVACWLMLVDMIRVSGSSLHATLCRTIEQAPITLFSAMSPGLTINRFSQDMSLVDMELPLSLSSLAITFMMTLGQFGLILSASRYLSAALPLVVGACIVIQRMYIKTSRQLRFHEIESKAPLYTQFIETLEGLVSVRAYRLQASLQDEMNHFVNECQKPFYLLACAQRYLGLTLNLTVAALVVLLVGIAGAARGHTDTSFYGLALVNIMTFGTNLAMVIDYWCNFEVSLAAVERTKEFSENTPKETTTNPEVAGLAQPFTKGALRIAHLSAEYKPGCKVLNDVSVSIHSGEKVAICGHSGSGKSTLCFAILRMLEVTSNTIMIDGRDISRISHDNLRKLISSVPQDPLILDGTIRLNVDPLGEGSGPDLIETLQEVGLWDKLQDGKQGLETSITSKSLSFAERQLICLARALLKRRKILVLDEATSSVDASTDQKIQNIVCKTLPGVTVVSVMHRFDHIGLYDRIILMSNGRIVEDGTPAELLARPSSLFSTLYTSEQTGE